MGAQKINWRENQVKGVVNYLTGQSSTKKNSFQLGNISDNSGQVNMLNDLAAVLRAWSKTIMCYMGNDCVYMFSLGNFLPTGFGRKFAIFVFPLCVAKLIVSQAHGPQWRRQGCSPRTGIPLECWQTRGKSCAPWYNRINLFMSECRKKNLTQLCQRQLMTSQTDRLNAWAMWPLIEFFCWCAIYFTGAR